ncbi:lipoyl domain-containing protein [Streptomyces sp. NPDC005356]|uniref:lipoyl domain-containing protein n=1 Tax=Streptomyces sp. NPDC005356 TaxID=3157167 RepID=UPI0033B1BFFE
MSVNIIVKLPKLGLTMQEGELVEWLVKDGDSIEAGQPIYLLATDKVEHEIEAPAAGTIHLVGEVENTYQVGDTLAKITPAA